MDGRKRTHGGSPARRSEPIVCARERGGPCAETPIGEPGRLREHAGPNSCPGLVGS